jgi:hypothetical protein
VKLILVQKDSDRLPLIKVFTHPWILHFQQKYNIQRAPSPLSSQASSSSEYEDSDEELDSEDSSEQEMEFTQ